MISNELSEYTVDLKVADPKTIRVIRKVDPQESLTWSSLQEYLLRSRVDHNMSLCKGPLSISFKVGSHHQDESAVIDMIEELSAKSYLHPDTMYLAIHLASMAIAQRSTKPTEKDLHRIALASASLAAKLREKDDRLGTRWLQDSDSLVVSSVLNLMRRSHVEAHKEEIEILQLSCWNLCIHTLYDFVNEFLCIGVLMEHDMISKENTELKTKPKNRLSIDSIEQFDSFLHKNSINYSENSSEETKVSLKQLPKQEILSLLKQITSDCEMLVGIVCRFMNIEESSLTNAAFYIVLLSRTMAGISEDK